MGPDVVDEVGGRTCQIEIGSVVTIYSDNEYESFDLDFVTNERMNQLEKVMNALGFTRALRPPPPQG